MGEGRGNLGTSEETAATGVWKAMLREFYTGMEANYYCPA